MLLTCTEMGRITRPRGAVQSLGVLAHFSLVIKLNCCLCMDVAWVTASQVKVAQILSLVWQCWEAGESLRGRTLCKMNKSQGHLP